MGTLYDIGSLIFRASGRGVSRLYTLKPEVQPSPTPADSYIDFSRSTTAVETLADGTISGVGVNMPRISYREGATCPSLLLEPARTNVARYSADFSDVTWAKIATGSGVVPVVDTDVATAPDGTSTADRVTFDASTAGGDRSLLRQSISALATTGKFSVWLKSESGTQYVNGHTGSRVTELVVTTEWKRFVFEHTGTGAVWAGLEVANGATTETYASILVWGFQVEDVNTYASSYIPTNEASSTRTEDAFAQEKSNIVDDPNMLTFAATLYPFDTSRRQFIALGNVGASEYIRIGVQSGTVRVLGFKNGTILYNHSSAVSFANLDKIMVACAHSQESVKVSINGSTPLEIASDIEAFESSFDALLSRQITGGDEYYGYLDDIYISPLKVSDSQLQSLTS